MESVETLGNNLEIFPNFDRNELPSGGQKCIICDRDQEYEISLDAECSFIETLLSAYKISQTSLRLLIPEADLSNVKGPLSCRNCGVKVKEMCSILQEIERLNSQYRNIFDVVNRKIAESYFKNQSNSNCETARSEQETKQEFSQSKEAIFKRIRHLLLQCFSDWKVMIPKLDTLKLQSKVQADCPVKHKRKRNLTPSNSEDLQTSYSRTSLRKLVDFPKLKAEPQQVIETTEAVNLEESNESPVDMCQDVLVDQPETQISCLVCQKSFKTEKNLRIHQVVVHKHPNRHKPKTPKRLKRLRNSKTCKGVAKDTSLTYDTFDCSKCNQTFKKSSNIDSEGRYSAVCEIFGCGKTYKSFKVFQKHHIATCQSTDDGTLAHCCDFCGRRCFSSQTLKAHIVSCHTKKFPFYCEVCGVGRATKTDLAGHMLCHTDEKKFQCQLCPESFKRKTRFTIHMRRHTNVCPFVCDVCGKRYYERQRLTKHKAVHSDEKKFPCNICGKFFASKNYVYNHIRFTHQKFKKNRHNEVRVEPEEPQRLESDPVAEAQSTVEWISTSQPQEENAISLPNNVNVKHITLQQMPESDSYFVEYTVEVESSNLAIL